MIAIVDYGMGNLRSVQKALEKAGADARIVAHPGELSTATKIVLPGVGAFADAMERLCGTGMVEPMVQAVRDGMPLLGICLGLQLMFDVSYEDGQFTGLGLLPGKVVRFDFHSSATDQSLRVPQMGWNQIHHPGTCPLFEGIPSGAYVYFAHSYYVAPLENQVTATTTDYGSNYASAVWSGNVYGCQFHPEKSQSVGLKILENFVRL